MIFVDIETYCAIDLRKVGVYRYVEDPSFEILLVCWSHQGKRGEWRLWETQTPPSAFLEAVNACAGGVAYNAQFERVCFGSQFAKRVGMPARLADINFWKCAQSRALCAGLPAKLEQCMQAFIPGHKKHVAGHRVMMKLSKPRTPTKNNPSRRWTPDWCPEDYANLVEYCHQDVADEMYLWENTRDLSEHEWRVYHLDQRINDRGVRVDLEAVTAAQYVAERRKQDLNNQCMRLTGLGLSAVGRLGDYLGVPALKADDLIDMLMRPGDFDPVQLEVIRLRQEFAKTSVAKLDAIMRAVCSDGRLRGMFQHAGAGATNRWAGRIVQLQNLPVATTDDVEAAIEDILTGNVRRIELLYGDVMGLLSALIRAMLVPEPGKVMNIVDYSAIEAVVLGWLADCEFYLDEFRGEGKMYEKMAGEIFGKQKDRVTKRERALGKAVILGCGFQMGEDRHVRETQARGSEEPEHVLRQSHSDYRKAVPEIADYDTGLWANMNAAAIYAVENSGAVVQTANGRIKFGVQGDWLYMVLPSGRPLAYFKPEIRRDEKFNRNGVTYMGVDSRTHQWTRIRTYGGKLTENAVQAIARDLLADAMLRLDAQDHKIVMHVHDEPVTEDARDRVAEIQAIMNTPPAWAEGMPIRTEGECVTRYKK